MNLAAIGVIFLVLGILSGAILAFAALGLLGAIVGVRRLDTDVRPGDGLAIPNAHE